MKAGSVRQGRERMFVLMFENGDEIVGGLEIFAKRNKIAGGQISAVGGLSNLIFGYFDRKSKKYKKSVEVRQPVRVLSFLGEIAYDKGRPRVLCHATVAKSDGSVLGGHLMHAKVQPLLEVIVMEASQFYQRTYDHDSGLALLRPDPHALGNRRRTR